MPIHLLTGPAHAGKTLAIMDALRAHLAHGEEPLLVVPTRADTEHYMRELARDSAALGARVERFAGLIADALARAGTSEPAFGALACERVLETIAHPGGPGLAHALGEAIAELQVRRVSPQRLQRALDEWAAQDGSIGASAALGSLYGEYLDTLARLGRVDSEQRAVRALDALRLTPALWGSTPVLFHGFDDLTQLQLDAIETLGRMVGAPVTVSLTYEPGRAAFAGRAATFAALAALADEHRQLRARSDYYASQARAALSHLERSLFENIATRVDPAGSVRLLQAGGERTELELVAGEIAALLDGGMAAQDIAVVVRGPGTSVELLEEVFSAAGVPGAPRRRRRLGDTSLGRALVGVLRCVPHSEQAGARHGEDAHAVQGGEAASHAEVGGQSEVGVSPGTLGDLLAWLRAPGLIERPEMVDGLERDARRMGVTSAARARELWERAHWRLEAIDRLANAQGRGCLALIDRAERELQWLFSAPRRRAASVLTVDQLDDARALAVGGQALDELRQLARVAPELAPADAAALAAWLERLEIVSDAAITTGRAAGGVAVLDPLSLLDAPGTRRVRALFVCGLQEGVFPARARSQPFLGEQERRRLAQTSGLLLGERAEALAVERHLLYTIVSRPEELLVLSWHVADDDGEPTVRSLFVDDVCDLFDEQLLQEPMPLPSSALRAGPGAAASLCPTTGKLTDERLLAELAAHVWSASSLEVWISCPVRWFVERMLRPGAIDPDPEPFARGGLAHAALKDTLEGLARERGSARLTPASLPRARELLRAALRENETSYPLSVAPERVPGTRRRLRADLERYLEHAAELHSPLEPTALELGFGFTAEDQRGAASELGAFELGDGVRMRGRIDRVDTDGAGQAVVYDYKGRSAPAGARWIGEGNLQVALYMRAVEGLLGLQAVGGFYQPLAGGDLRARGVLDRDSAIELDCVRGELREHAEVRELLDAAREAALQAAAQAARGELTPRPRTCAYNGGCMYPTICRCER